MKAANTIFILIPVLLLVPMVFFTAKHVYAAVKKGRGRIPWHRLAILLVTAGLVIAFSASLYNFMINHQVRLVAERIHVLFAHRVEGTLDANEFEKKIQRAGLDGEGFNILSDDAIDEAGFTNTSYDISLSKKIYEGNRDDEAVIYAQYQRSAGEKIYAALRLKSEGNRWRAVEHTLLTGEDIKDADPNMSFFRVK